MARGTIHCLQCLEPIECVQDKTAARGECCGRHCKRATQTGCHDREGSSRRGTVVVQSPECDREGRLSSCTPVMLMLNDVRGSLPVAMSFRTVEAQGVRPRPSRAPHRDNRPNFVACPVRELQRHAMPANGWVMGKAGSHCIQSLLQAPPARCVPPYTTASQ